MTETLSCSFIQDVCSGIVATVIGGVLLAGLIYLAANWIFGVPQIYGNWYCVTQTRCAKLSKYLFMNVTYKVLLQQEGSRIQGTGEKIDDVTDNGAITTYDFDKRVPIKITGYIRKRYLGKSEVLLHIDENGRKRDTSAMHVLSRKNKLLLAGTFSWTASDSHGKVMWHRGEALAPPKYPSSGSSWIALAHRFLGCLAYCCAVLAVRLDLLGLRMKAAHLVNRCQSYELLPTPRVLMNMLVLAEDKRYYEHTGVDLKGICRALWGRLRHGKIEGASTIEQQLVRVVTGDFEFSMKRKFREILLASIISRKLPKDSIACIYLSLAHFGTGMDGLTRACGVLGKDPNCLSADDAAALVSMLRYPRPRKQSDTWSAKFNRRKCYVCYLYSQAERLPW